MLENKKEIHIVFQVLNFITGISATDLKLNSSERLLLITLAKHQGKNGIYPSTSTLAKELGKTPTYIKKLINKLDARGIIKIDRKLGVRHHYQLIFLSGNRSTTVDQSTTVDRSTRVSGTGQPEFRNRSTTVDRINTDNQNRNINTERARKKRAPLSDHFLPDEKRNSFLIEVANKVQKPPEQLLAKFKNLQKSKDGLSADWNAELENFLLNERPMGYLGNGNGNGRTEMRCTVPFYDDPSHPTYAERKRVEEALTKQREQSQVETVVEVKPLLHFRETQLYKERLHGGKPNGKEDGDGSAGIEGG